MMNGVELARSALFPCGEPPLSFERWCDMAPRLLEREAHEREEILAAANIPLEDWTPADGYWSLTLAAECARGDRARAEVFGRACADELAARRQVVEKEAPAHLEDAGEMPRLLEASPPVEPPPLPAVVVVPPMSVPTFLRVEPVAPVGSSTPVRPPRSASEAPVSSTVPPPALACAPMTKDMPAFDFPAPRPALPFSSRPSEGPSRPALRLPPKPQSGETVDLTHLAMPPAPSVPARPMHAPPQAQRDPTATVALDPEIVARLLAPTPPEKR